MTTDRAAVDSPDSAASWASLELEEIAGLGDCLSAEELSGWLDGTLDPDEWVRARTHLDECRRCTAEVDARLDLRFSHDDQDQDLEEGDESPFDPFESDFVRRLPGRPLPAPASLHAASRPTLRAASPRPQGSPVEPAESAAGPTRTGQEAILTYVLSVMTTGRPALLSAADALACIEPFPVEVRHGVARLGIVPRRVPPPNTLSKKSGENGSSANGSNGANGSNENGSSEQPTSDRIVLTPIELYTDLPDGTAILRLRRAPVVATHATSNQAVPRFAPLLELSHGEQKQLYRVTSHLIPLRPDHSPEVMDYVQALLRRSECLADVARPLVPLGGTLRPDQRAITLGHAASRHHVRLAVPSELRRTLAVGSLPYEIDFPPRDPDDPNKGVFARLRAADKSFHYQLTSSGHHSRWLGTRSSAWPEFWDYCLALVDSGFYADGRIKRGAERTLAAGRRMAAASRALLAGAARVELSATSMLRLGRLADRSLDVRLPDLPAGAEVLVRAQRLDENHDVMLAVEQGDRRIELKVDAAQLLSYGDRLNKPDEEEEQGTPAPPAEQPRAVIVRLTAVLPGKEVVRITANGLTPYFRRAENLWKALTARLPKPSNAGEKVVLGVVEFTALPGSNRDLTWSFEPESDIVSKLRSIPGLEVEANTGAPPLDEQTERVLDPDAWAVSPASPGARATIFALLRALGKPPLHEEEKTLLSGGTQVMFFTRRLLGTGRPAHRWAYRIRDEEGLERLAQNLAGLEAIPDAELD